MIDPQDHTISKLRIVADVDREPKGESKTCANPVECVMTCNQLQTKNALRFAQIDLHPLRNVLFCLDLTMVSKLRLLVATYRLSRFGNPMIQLRKWLTPSLVDLLIDLADL